MALIKRLFDFYLQSSLHVALSVYALIRVTEMVLHLLPNGYLAGFGFFGTVVGYNFVKYDATARSKTNELAGRMKAFIAVSIVAFAGAVYCFLMLHLMTQIVSGVFVLIMKNNYNVHNNDCTRQVTKVP